MNPLTITLKASALSMVIGLGLATLTSSPAQAQVDSSKHWYTVFTKGSLPAGGGCASVDIKYVTAPNMRANQLMAPPYGFTRVFKNSSSVRTRARGGWCPKSISAATCEGREKLRDKNVWHNWLARHSCATVRWNNTILYSK